MKRRINPYRVLGTGLDFLTHPTLWIIIGSVVWLVLGWQLWQWSDGDPRTEGDDTAFLGFVFWCVPTIVVLGVFAYGLFVWLRDDLPRTLLRKSTEWEERNGVWIHEQHEWVEDE